LAAALLLQRRWYYIGVIISPLCATLTTRCQSYIFDEQALAGSGLPSDATARRG
jgi:hypothetical protein